MELLYNSWSPTIKVNKEFICFFVYRSQTEGVDQVNSSLHPQRCQVGSSSDLEVCLSFWYKIKLSNFTA